MNSQEEVVCEVTRDSVCYADDIDAPHTISFTLPYDADLAELVKRIRASGFMPSVAGRVEWILEGPEALARLDGQGRYVKFLGHRDSLVGEPGKYHLRYNPAYAHNLSLWHRLAIRLGILGVPLKQSSGLTVWDRVVFAVVGVVLIALGLDAIRTGVATGRGASITDPADVKIASYLYIIAGIATILAAIIWPKSMSGRVEEDDEESAS